jgi:CRISPR system Cascade subunit CasA
MNRPSFDVLSEPWIPVIGLDGSGGGMGVLACLEQAHTIREIRDPVPIVEFGLHRILVAFVLDALVLAERRPEVPHDLRDLIDEGAFDKDFFRRYVEVCGDVFDLFHPASPFLQTPVESGDKKPLAGVFPAIPSGTNVAHWHHAPEEEWAVSAPEAARLLTTIAPFMTAGGAGLSPSINGAPGVYVLPLGRNLFETLILNIPLRTEQEGGVGNAAWRDTGIPGRERSEATTVEALTWRPRRIQLVAEATSDSRITVKEMKFERGDSARLEWIDSSLAYRYGKDRITPVRMRENRALWRDAGPLLLLSQADCSKGDTRVVLKRPDVVDQAYGVDIAGIPVGLQAYGMRTDLKMKVFEWAKGTWEVPRNLGSSTRLGAIVHEELDRAEKAAWAIGNAIRSLHAGKGPGGRDSLGSMSVRAERAFWQALERQFRPLMNAFASLDADAPDDVGLIVAAASDWREAIRDSATVQFELAAKDMDADGEALERLVRARAWLSGFIRKVLT